MRKGILQKGIQYLNALEEEQYAIAHAATARNENGLITEKFVEVRKNGNPLLVKREDVDYMEVATNQPFSVATALIPFVENDDANRALMGSNMQKQAVPLVVPQAPLVATGVEAMAAHDSGRLVVASEAGEITYADAQRIEVKGASGKAKEYKLVNFSRTNGFTTFHHRPAVSPGQHVKRARFSPTLPLPTEDSLQSAKMFASRSSHGMEQITRTPL